MDHVMLKFDGQSTLQNPKRHELEAEFEAIAGRKFAAFHVCAVTVTGLALFAMVAHIGDFEPADTPAVMTGGPAAAPNVPRPDRVTTLGETIPSAQVETSSRNRSTEP